MKQEPTGATNEIITRLKDQNDLLKRTILENEMLKTRYKRLFDDAPCGYVIFRYDGTITTANRTFCSMVGGTGNKITDYVLPEFHEELYAMMRRLLETGEPQALELGLISPDGPVTAMVSSNCFLGGDQDDVLIRSVVNDITSLKRLQRQILNESLLDPLTGFYNRRYYKEMLSQQDRPENLPISAAMIDIDGLKMINDSLGHNFGDQAITTLAELMQKYAGKDTILIRTGGDEIVILFLRTELAAAEEYIRQVKSETETHMLSGIPLTFSWGASVKRLPDESLTAVLLEAEDMMYSRKLLKKANSKSEIVKLIAQSLFERNRRIECHCHRVSEIAQRFARRLGLNGERLNFYDLLGFFHDIGMTSVPDEILNKVTPLTEADWKEIRRHPEVSYRILSSTPGMSELAKAALFHHEHWDGSGYPNGVSGKNIPFESRVIAIVDAYDRMAYGMYGKPPLPTDQIRREFRRCSGTQFDPNLARMFVQWFVPDNSHRVSSGDFRKP